MIFTPVKLAGAWVIDLERREDSRGFFARSWCKDEFAKHGLVTEVSQCNISFNATKGTLRGLHYQTEPHSEVKLVRCTRGAIYDVIIDLRPDSASFKEWFAIELTADNHRTLYIPERFAHGFQTLHDSTEVFYLMSESFHAESARGVRWNDPAFGIRWPDCEHRIISEKDASFPDVSFPDVTSQTMG